MTHAQRGASRLSAARRSCSGWRFSLADLLLITGAVAAHLAAFVCIDRYLTAAGERHVLTVLIGMPIAWLIACALGWWYFRTRGGRVRFVLHGRLPRKGWLWLGFGGPATAIGLYVVLQQNGYTQLWQGVTVGFLGGLSINLINSTLLLLYLPVYFCDHGIVLGTPPCFTAWSRIRSVRWGDQHEDRLVLNSGRILTVAVPADWRQPMTEFLKSKLGDRFSQS